MLLDLPLLVATDVEALWMQILQLHLIITLQYHAAVQFRAHIAVSTSGTASASCEVERHGA